MASLGELNGNWRLAKGVARRVPVDFPFEQINHLHPMTTNWATDMRLIAGDFRRERHIALHLEWVAQLKPGLAQRVANDIGQSFSRVGVVEAEWLRLLTT